MLDVYIGNVYLYNEFQLSRPTNSENKEVIL